MVFPAFRCPVESSRIGVRSPAARSFLLCLLLAGRLAAITTVGAQEAGPPSSSAFTGLGELSIEQLLGIQVENVYGASKHEQKVTHAPASVSIVTAAEIQKFGHRTLADVLRSVRGLYVSDDRNYSYLGVRGFLRPGDYNTRVLVLIDGHRMNDNVYDGAYFGREATIDVDLIDRVEVIRGPGSSIYGSSAFFGVVNIVTKRGAQINGVEASGEAGGFGSYKGRFTMGRMYENDVEWLLSGSYYTSDGRDRLYFPEFDQRISNDPRAANNGVARNLDGEAVFNLFTSLGYKGFTLSGAFNHRTKDVPTASFGTVFNDGREKTIDYRAYVDLNFNHDFSEDLRLQGRLFYDNSSYYGTYPYDYADPGDPPDEVLFKDGTVGDWVGTEWQLTSKLLDRHTVIVGGEYRENLREHQFAYDDVEPRSYYLDDDRSSRTLGLFAQGEAVLRSNLLFTAGVRYDHYFQSIGGTANPRLGLIYGPWENGTFKALFGRAFRAPNPYERYYNPEQQFRPDLDPETIRTYELVYEQYVGRHYRLSISGYLYETDDLISQAETPGGELYFDNLNKARAHGVEFEVEGKLDSGLLARASYALQRAEDGDTGMELSGSPRHLGKLNLAVPVYSERVFAGLELQYMGSVKTISGNTASDFLTANFTLFSRELVKGLEASAGIYNLFDTQYGYPGAADHLQDVIRQNSRSFRVKLSYRF